MTFLFDLDDCIINSKHRSLYNKDGSLVIDHFIKNSTSEKIQKDTLYNPMYNILKYTQNRQDCLNVCITSRELLDSDFDFFKKHKIYFHYYLHRGSNMLLDKKHLNGLLKDYELKRVLLENYFWLTDPTPVYGFDDKTYNLDVFNDFGFKTYNSIDINTNKIHYKTVIEEIEQKLKDICD